MRIKPEYPLYIRIISIILLVTFLSYDITWAYPRDAYASSDTLAPQTVFTSGDMEQRAGVVAKYIREAVGRRFGLLPLVGVREQLTHICDMFSSLSGIQSPIDSTYVGSELFLRLSDDLVMRFYSLNKAKELGAPQGIVLEEFQINQTVGYQLIKNHSKDKMLEGESARVETFLPMAVNVPEDSVPREVIAGYREEIEALIKELKALASKQVPYRPESKYYFELNSTQRILGLLIGTLTGSIYLSLFTGLSATLFSFGMAGVALFWGWYVHEKGHSIGERYGHFMHERGGPLASLFLAMVSAALAIPTALSALYTMQLTAAFFLVVAATAVTHTFADEMVLYRRSDHFMERFRLDRMLMLGFNLMCDTPDDSRAEKELFGRIGKIFKETAPIKDLKDERKLMMQNFIITNINPVGSDRRNSICQDVVGAMLEDDNPDVWGPMLEVMVEDLAMMRNMQNEKFFELIYHVLVKSERLANFVDAMVKVYVDAHTGDAHTMELPQKQYIKQIEDLFRRIDVEDPLMGERLFEGIGKYTGTEWVSSIDSESIEKAWRRTFVNALKDTESLFIRDKYKAKQFCINYFHMTLDRCLEQDEDERRIERTEDGYKINRNGVQFLINRVRFGHRLGRGGLSYAEILELTSKFIPGAIQDLKADVRKNMGIKADMDGPITPEEWYYSLGANTDKLLIKLNSILGAFSSIVNVKVNSSIMHGDELHPRVAELAEAKDSMLQIMMEIARTREYLPLEMPAGKNELTDSEREIMERTSKSIMELVHELHTLMGRARRRDLLTHFADGTTGTEALISSAIQDLSLGYVRTANFIRTNGDISTSGMLLTFDLNDNIRFAKAGAGLMNGRIKLDLDEGVLPVQGDELLLYEVWDNLISNARRSYKSQKGFVTIRTYRDATSGEVVVEFSDEGCGMKKEELEEIFETHYRTSQKSSKSIGLSLSKEIIEIAGGRIEIDSVLNKGTTVKVTLPAADPEKIVPESFSKLYLRDFRYSSSLLSALEVYRDEFSLLSADGFVAAEYRRLREEAVDGKISYASALRELEVLAGIGLLDADRTEDVTVYSVPEQMVNMPPQRFDLIKALVGDVSGCPDEDYVKNLWVLLRRIENEYGWELVDGVLASDPQTIRGIKDIQREAMSLYKEGELEGDPEKIQMLKRHAIGSAKYTSRVIKVANTRGSQDELTEEALRLAAIAHSLGKGISSEKLELHFSDKYKSNMSPEEQKALTEHSRDVLKVLLEKGLRIPPVTLIAMFLDYADDLRGCLMAVNPPLWKGVSIFLLADEFRSLTEPRLYEREMWLETEAHVEHWLRKKIFEGMIEESDFSLLERVFSEEMKTFKGSSFSAFEHIREALRGETFEHIRGAFKGETFDFEEFKNVRIELQAKETAELLSRGEEVPQDDVRGDTTFRSELRALEWLGILDVKKEGKKKTYTLKDIYARGPPVMISEVKVLLRMIAPTATKDQHLLYGKMLDSMVKRYGYKDVAEKVKAYEGGEDLKEIIKAIKLFWGKGYPSEEEKKRIRDLLPTEEDRLKFDATVGSIRRKQIKGGRLYIGDMVESLVADTSAGRDVPEDAEKRSFMRDEVAMSIRGLNHLAVDVAEDLTLFRNRISEEAMSKRAAGIYAAVKALPGEMLWVAGLYFGHRAAFDKEFRQGRFSSEETIDSILEAKDRFFELLPDEVRDEVVSEYEQFRDSVYSEDLTKDENELAFLDFITTLWYPHTIFYSLEKAQGEEKEDVSYLLEVVSQTGRRAEKIREGLEKALYYLKEGNYKKAREWGGYKIGYKYAGSPKGRKYPRRSDNPEIKAMHFHIDQVEALKKNEEAAQSLRVLDMYLRDELSVYEIADKVELKAGEVRQILRRSLDPVKYALPNSLRVKMIRDGLENIYISAINGVPSIEVEEKIRAEKDKVDALLDEYEKLVEGKRISFSSFDWLVGRLHTFIHFQFDRVRFALKGYIKMPVTTAQLVGEDDVFLRAVPEEGRVEIWSHELRAVSAEAALNYYASKIKIAPEDQENEKSKDKKTGLFSMAVPLSLSESPLLAMMLAVVGVTLLYTGIINIVAVLRGISAEKHLSEYIDVAEDARYNDKGKIRDKYGVEFVDWYETVSIVPGMRVFAVKDKRLGYRMDVRRNPATFSRFYLPALFFFKFRAFLRARSRRRKRLESQTGTFRKPAKETVVVSESERRYYRQLSITARTLVHEVENLMIGFNGMIRQMDSQKVKPSDEFREVADDITMTFNRLKSKSDALARLVAGEDAEGAKIPEGIPPPSKAALHAGIMVLAGELKCLLEDTDRINIQEEFNKMGKLYSEMGEFAVKTLVLAYYKTASFITFRGGANSKGEASPMSVNTSIRMAYEILKYKNILSERSGYEILLELDDVPAVHADGLLMLEVVLNLMKNSLEAMSDTGKKGGTITVSTKYDETKEEVHITIEDEGLGIPELNQDSIFDPYFTTKGYGTGLGLVLCRDIVQAAKGSIRFDSTFGEGTTFLITLPALSVDVEPDPGVVGTLLETFAGKTEVKKSEGPKGDIIHAFDDILADDKFREKEFTRKEFAAKRSSIRGEGISETTAANELSALALLGIVAEDKTQKAYNYKFNSRCLRGPPGTLNKIREILGELSDIAADPDREAILAAKERLNKEVYNFGQVNLAIVKNNRLNLLHLIEKVSEYDIELIGLSAERSSVEHNIRVNGPTAEKERALDDVSRRIRELKRALQAEMRLLILPEYPLRVTGGRDYRTEAGMKLRRALKLIEKKNEPAACASMCAALNLLSKELELLSKFGRRRYTRRAWVDAKSEMVRVMKGQYHYETTPEGLTVNVKEKKPAGSENIWQAIRSRDREINGSLLELDWIRGLLPRLESEVRDLWAKKRELPRSRREEGYQIVLSEEEKARILSLMKEISGKYKKARKEEKKLAFKADLLAEKLLFLGENRAVLEMLSYAESLIKARKSSLEGQIENTTRGRLEALRKMIHSRNSYLVYKVDTIDSMLASGRASDASAWIYGILHDKTMNNVTREPEFHRMNRVLFHAISMIEKGQIYKARKDIKILKDRLRLAELLNSFMQDVRDEYVEARRSGASERVYDSIFNSKFNQYLDFARENNIGRGSPRLLWTVFYQAAYVSMKMPDPDKKSKKIDNPLFEAFSEFERMLEVNSTRSLINSLKKTAHQKYSNLIKELEGLSKRGLVHFGYLEGVDYVKVLSAMAEDLKLADEQREELIQLAFFDDDAKEFTDIERLEIYWEKIADGYAAKVAGGRTSGARKGVFEELFDLSCSPEHWPEQFEEEWEEGFIEEISALSANDVVERFLSYYSELHRDMKSLRNVKDAIAGSSTLQDIHVNINPQQMSPKVREKYGRSLKEQNWLLREWIYRHWTSSPKERSYSRMKRLEGGVTEASLEVGLPGMETVPFEGDRAGTMYLNEGDFGHIFVSENLKEIESAVSSNGFYSWNRRAVTVELPSPVMINGRLWNRVYIKGIVFDQTKDLVLHEGDDAHGFSDYRMEVDHAGRFYYPGAIASPYGAMGFELAQTEFLNHYSMYHSMGLEAQGVFVSAPLGYGIFPNAPLHRGKALGFVVLGMDASMPARRINNVGYVETAARTLRALHEEGYVHPYLHLGNLSSDRARVYLHDLDSVKRLESSEENYKEIMTSQMRDLFYLFSKCVGEYTEGHDPVSGRLIIDRDAFWYGQARALVNGYFQSLTEEESEELISAMIRSFDEFAELYYIDNIKEIKFEEFMSMNREVANILHKNLKRRMELLKRKRSGRGPLLSVVPFVGSESIKIWGILAVLGLTGVALCAHEVLRQAKDAGKFDDFIANNPRFGLVVKWMLSRRLVPEVLSNYISGFFTVQKEKLPVVESEDLHRSIPEKDPHFAAKIISSYYRDAALAKEISEFKICEDYALFAPSDKDLIVRISEEFITDKSRVIDLGSGNGQAAAIFGQFAGSVKAIELNRELHGEALYAYEGLLPRVDTSKVELVNGDFLEEDLSEYDLAYIYWPYTKISEAREKLTDNLRKMKRGAIFVCNLENLDKELKGFDRLNNPEGIPSNVFIYQKKTGRRGYDLGYEQELVDVTREPRYIEVKSSSAEKLVNQLALELEEITYVLEGSRMPWLMQNMMTLAYTLERLRCFGKGAREEYSSRGEMQSKFAELADVADWRQMVGAIVVHIVDPANRADYGDFGSRLAKFMASRGKAGIEEIIDEYEWLFAPSTMEAVQYGMINRLIDRTVLDGDISAEEAMERLEDYPADLVDIVLIRLRKIVSANGDRYIVSMVEHFLEEYKAAIRSAKDKTPAGAIDIERTISDITNLLKDIAYKKGKIILAIDCDLASGWTKHDLEDVVRELSRISRRDDELGNMIKNVVIRSGDSKSLARDIKSLTSRGGIKKENVIVVTNERNLEDFSAFEGTATITGINDNFWKEGFYYPMTEVVRFTVAMSLAKVVDMNKETLMGYLKSIPNLEDLDDEEMWQLCWDDASGSYRTTFIIKIIPNAVKVPDKGIYKQIEEYIRTNA